MAFVLRWINLVLILIFFVLALVGTCPLSYFAFNLDGLYEQQGKISATMWYVQTDEIRVTPSGGVAPEVTMGKEQSIRINYLNCTEERSYWRSVQAFSIAGTVLGFYSFLICLLMCACHLKVKLPLFLFLIFAFISELMCLIMGAVVFTKSFCVGKPNMMNSFKDMGFKIQVGYILQIIACAGYLVCMIITPFTQELWCGSC